MVLHGFYEYFFFYGSGALLLAIIIMIIMIIPIVFKDIKRLDKKSRKTLVDSIKNMSGEQRKRLKF